MKARIAGVADTELGRLNGRTPLDLSAEAAVAVCDDAQLPLASVDGLITNIPMVGAASRPAVALAEYLGIQNALVHCSSPSLGGAAPLAAVARAAELVEADRCETVLVVCADSPRTGQARSTSVEAFARMRHPDWEQPFGVMNVSAYALLARSYIVRYRHEEGVLSAMPLAMRAFAHTNPSAVYRDPLTAEDVAGSRTIATPLRLLECSPICDGGGAVLVTSDPGGKRDVRVRAYAEGYRYDSVSFAGDLSRTGASFSGARCFSQAGMSPHDMDVALLYDSYSITLALELEELGLCPPGEAPSFVADGGIGLDGAIPVNPHGGLLSFGHCGNAAGIHHLTEAIRQLSGDAANQVSGARRSLLHAEGGIISANCTAIFES